MYIDIKDFSLFQSIHSIKIDLMKKYNKNSLDGFYLKYNTQILENNKTLYHYGINKNDKIELIERQKGGKNMAYGLKVFLFVLVFLVFYFLLLIGVIPFISFLISNILIKGLKIVFNFILNFVDKNNWLYNFTLFIINWIIPFLQFIFEYAGLFLFSFFLTFFCTYKLYYFAFTKGERDESINKQCRAFKTTNIVAGITSLMICIFYFIANIPIMMGNIIGKFMPPPVKSPLKNAFLKLGEFRSQLLGLFGPVGMVEKGFLMVMSYLFKGLNFVKGYDADFLYNWSKIYEMTKIPPLMQYVQEAKIEEVLAFVNYAEKSSTGKCDKTLTAMSFNEAASAIALRSSYDNLMYVILRMIDLLDICGDQPALLDDLIYQKEKVQKMMKSVENTLESDNKLNKNTKAQMRKSIQKFLENINNLNEQIEKQKEMKLLDVTCLMNILTNGALFSLIIIILFTIIFIVFFFVKL